MNQAEGNSPRDSREKRWRWGKEPTMTTTEIQMLLITPEYKSNQ